MCLVLVIVSKKLCELRWWSLVDLRKISGPWLYGMYSESVTVREQLYEHNDSECGRSQGFKIPSNRAIELVQ
jgi:hypothetical protein